MHYYMHYGIHYDMQYYMHYDINYDMHSDACWYTPMHSHVLGRTQMHSDTLQCTLMHSDAFCPFSENFQKLQRALFCYDVHHVMNSDIHYFGNNSSLCVINTLDYFIFMYLISIKRPFQPIAY